MSKNAIIAIIVVVIVAGGLAWYYAANQNGGTQTAVTAPAAVNQNTGTAAVTAGTANTQGTGLSNGTSDAALNADLSAIDNQLNGLASDSANVDQSLSSSSQSSAQ